MNVDEPAIPVGDGGLIRLRLDLRYDGTDFSGWARQPELRTVQGTVEAAIVTVLRLAERATLIVAGRTDAGVHATGQVAHVDLPADVDPDALHRRLSGVLPADLAVVSVMRAAPGFDARFAAVGRRYRYRIADGALDPLRRNDTAFSKRALDVAAMHQAAQALVGKHDFAAYCKPREGATTIRVLRALDVVREPDGTVVIGAHADAFCHHQVRSMVGALLTVGEGRRPVAWVGELLAAGVRDPSVAVAPPHGLTLVGIDYPPDEELAAQAVRARQRRGTLFDHAGGAEAMLALAHAHHARCIADPELNHPFSHPGGHPQHTERLAAYWGEVLGGPAEYSEHCKTQTDLLAMHAGNGDMTDLGRRFVDCFVAAADDAGLPDDARFRDALRSYMEWAVARFIEHPTGTHTIATALAVPRWDWDGLVSC